MSYKTFAETPDAATGQTKLATAIDNIHNPPTSTLSGESLDIITVPELCRRLDICRRTESNLRERGKLPFIRLGRCVRYHWPSVEAALLRQQRGQ
jgi:hypothetical protein